MPSHCLTAIYDLRICPETFDIADFLSLVESEAEQQKVARIEFIIYAPRTLSDRSHARRLTGHTSPLRLSNILLQCLTGLKGSVPRDISVIPTYSELKRRLERNCPGPRFPKDYTPESPTEAYSVKRFIRQTKLPRLGPSRDAVLAAKRWLGERNLLTDRLVTITLRESKVSPERNSDTLLWLQIAKTLKADHWDALILRDTDLCFSPLPESSHISACPDASLNIGFRSALYHQAKLNIHLTGGPSTLCITSPICSFLYFFKIVKDCGAVSLGGLLHDAFLPGSQWPEPSQSRRVFWECQSREAIEAAIDTMLQEIGEGQSPRPDTLISQIKSALEAGDTNKALSSSSIAQSLHPTHDEINLLRFLSLRAANRIQEATLFYIHFSTNTKYRDFNYALKALNDSFKSADFALMCDAVADSDFSSLSPLHAAFLKPTVKECWVNALNYLIAGKRFPLALELHGRIALQHPSFAAALVNSWHDPIESLLESEALGRAFELTNKLYERIPCNATLTLKQRAEQQCLNLPGVKTFIERPSTDPNALADSIQNLGDSAVPRDASVVIYGAGAGGVQVAETCRRHGLKILAYSQTREPDQSQFAGYPLLSLKDACLLNPNYFLIASESYRSDMLLNLLGQHIECDRIRVAFSNP